VGAATFRPHLLEHHVVWLTKSSYRCRIVLMQLSTEGSRWCIFILGAKPRTTNSRKGRGDFLLFQIGQNGTIYVLIDHIIVETFQILRCVQCWVECRMYDSVWVSKRQAAQKWTLSILFNTDFRAVATTDLWVLCYVGREICRTKNVELIYGRVNIDVCSSPALAVKKLVCELNKNNATWLWQFLMLSRIIVDLKCALLV